MPHEVSESSRESTAVLAWRLAAAALLAARRGKSCGLSLCSPLCAVFPCVWGPRYGLVLHFSRTCAPASSPLRSVRCVIVIGGCFPPHSTCSCASVCPSVRLPACSGASAQTQSNHRCADQTDARSINARARATVIWTWHAHWTCDVVCEVCAGVERLPSCRFVSVCDVEEAGGGEYKGTD